VHQFPDAHGGVKEQLQQNLVLDVASLLDDLDETLERRLRRKMGQFLFAPGRVSFSLRRACWQMYRKFVLGNLLAATGDPVARVQSSGCGVIERRLRPDRYSGWRPALQIPGAELICQLLSDNKVMLGSVNAAHGHFQIGVSDLEQGHLRWGAHPDKLITERYKPDQFVGSSDRHELDSIKQVIEWT
jgi:hypothetical protein